jgi:hypothetical protein
MRRNRFLPVLLWIACFAPAALGQGFTAMTICNAGTVSVDAYVMLEGKLTEKSIAPADCARLPAPTPTPAPAAAPAAPARVGPDLLVESVIQLLKAKTPETRIMQVIQADGKPHPLTGAERARLEDSGASENLMDALEHPKPAK